jgi:hypothetical protein
LDRSKFRRAPFLQLLGARARCTASGMSEPRPPHQDTGPIQLRDIARTAMLERSLEPDFSRAALAEVASFQHAAAAAPADAVRDLRELLWV